MLRKAFNILIFNILFVSGFSQTGGDNVYEFLNLTHSAYISSIGGSNVSVFSNDLNMAYHNPGLLDSSMDKSIVLNYVNYFAGINYGMAMYSRSFEGIGNFGTGITYLNYGSFTEADESGNITGNFTASEYAFSLLYSRNIDTLFNIGANLKPVLSHLEKYSSFGLALDIGASYHSRSSLFSAGLALRNIGLQLTSYAGEDKQPLPFEIQAGVSQRLAHAPFRFSLTLRHLEKFDLTHQYILPVSTEEPEISDSDFGENLLRHMVFGIELIPHKNFYISGGYNYQRRSELKIDQKVSTVGLSWGFGIKTSFIDVEFGRATYHLAGSSNHISLILRPDMIYKKGSL
ncbi:MAG: type IX secretion system protein PorQ [Bacteroidetes bacterium]|nr:type IX secretion system protein PorQ [Bacteroidota bacterium]